MLDKYGGICYYIGALRRGELKREPADKKVQKLEKSS